MKGPLPYLLLLFLIALLFHATFLLYVVYALFAALLLARLWARRALRGIVTTRRLDDHAFLDDEIPVALELRNAGRLPVTWVLARESLPVELAGPLRVAHALSLAPGERRTLRYTLQGRQRGLYTLGPVRLSGGDLFGQEEYYFASWAIGRIDEGARRAYLTLTQDELEGRDWSTKPRPGETRAQQTLLDTEAVLHECQRLQQHLLQQDTLIVGICAYVTEHTPSHTPSTEV